MAVKAENNITLTNLNDIQTVSLDADTGLTLSSPNSESKVVIDNDSVDIYSSEGKMATSIEAGKITLGIDEDIAEPIYGDGEDPVDYEYYYGLQVKVDPLTGLNLIGGNPKTDGERKELISLYNGGTNRNPRGTLSALYDLELVSDSGVGIFSNEIKLITIDANPGNTYISAPPDHIFIGTNGQGEYQTLADYISQHSGGSSEWTLISNNTGGGTKTWTIDNLHDYKEFMVIVSASRTNGRTLASTTIPAERFFAYTSDHGNGAHQAVHNSTYTAGVSYLGGNKIKLYETTDGYCNFYGR